MTHANPPNPKQRYGDVKVQLGLVPPATLLKHDLDNKINSRRGARTL